MRAFANAISGISTFYAKLGNFFLGPLADITGFTNTNVDAFGHGMLAFYYEPTATNGEKAVGVRGKAYNSGSLWNWDSIKVSAEKKLISISRNEFLNFNNAMEFSVDGWVGRYGMPLDFLLSIHLATLKPDLAVDMATAFPTNVNIYLHEVSGEAIPIYKAGPDYPELTMEQIEALTPDRPGPEWIEARDKGLPVAYGNPYCECTFTDINQNPLIYNIEEDRYEYANGTIYEGEVYCIPCEQCKKTIEAIIKYMKNANDTKYLAYQPYIASVTNHWFRDVYFVLDEAADTKDAYNRDIAFVDYDYDFETLYKERWTLYETDENGEFILYKLNDDGTYGEKFDGTAEEAEKQGIKVVKKAKTLDNRDVLVDDLDWNYKTYDIGLSDLFDNSSFSTIGEHRVWSAYDASGSGSGGALQPLKLNDGEEYGGDWNENIYVKLNMYGNIVQKGEGQRTETNPKIKDMFLNNYYFTYDGGTEKAEAIMKLRKKVAEKAGKGSWYKAVPYEEEYLDLSTEINGKTYTVGECIASVGRTTSVKDSSGNGSEQELLNVSGMLENIHTQDADAISRDFKELIVELGYYKKEELTDTTPKMLQWLVPNTGSYGYPKRSIDKNENEYGSMVHSKGDIRAKNVLMLKELMENYEETGDETVDESGEGTEETAVVQNKIDNNKLLALNNDGLSKIRGQKNNLLAPDITFEDTSTTNLEDTVGGSGFNRDPEDVSTEEFIEAAKKVHAEIQTPSEAWEYCAAGKHSGDASRHSNNGGGHNMYGTLEDARAGQRTVDCSTFVSWVLQEVGIFAKGERMATGGMYSKFADYIYTREEAGELQEGDILLSSDHTQINGEEDGGSFIQYNAGSTNAIREEPSAGSPDFYTHVIRFRFNNKQKGKPYKGYNGNEAVVSPVTGILLEYGTYDEYNKDNISGEEYRTNIDYKYNSNKIATEGENGENNEEQGSVDIPIDKVGYAKILVLDNKTYSIFEKSFGDELSSLNNGDSFVNSDGKIKEIADLDKDKIKEWNDKEKTLYGYKEFAELYEKGGIAGNILYIDGFVCEYPDQNYPTGSKDDKTESKNSKFDFTPKGTAITINDFKNITKGNISKDNKTNEKGDKLSEYIKDNEYKLASKKVTDRLNAETKIKEDTSPTFFTGGPITIKLNENSGEVSYDGIFIKEGTVIGRTMTDYELIEDMRGQKYGTYEELRKNTGAIKEDESEEAHIIGNYLRVQMRDYTRDNVENIEDYFKLDDGSSSNNLRILDDFDVTDETNFPTLEQFLIMFADCPVIMEFAEDFLKMQEEYGINAAYAAVVTLVESSGGTNWNAIDPSTHNWFSIKGDYNGSSLNGWRNYPDFDYAIYDFGDLMKNGGHYVDKGNHFVSQIGPIYCPGGKWEIKVNDILKQRYEKVLGGGG